MQVCVSGSLGSPLSLTLIDADSHTVTADTGAVLLQAAANRPLTRDDVVAAVGQLGDNTLTPADVDVSGLALEQGLFLPASAFKSVRRAAADQLLALRQQHSYAQDMAQHSVLPELLTAAAAATTNSITSASNSSTGQQSTKQKIQRRSIQEQSVTGHKLRVLCRTPGQVQAALKVPWLEEVIVDFLEVHGLKEAVAAVKAAGKQVVVALPRILKPGGW
eukprot:GHUV01040652.1.p1 GENE.GHUV01040652.1~~GHUV01040652.1.p1  ORF type:complete len:219 (+),score=71.18 GHUV01040652.1:243-899(+)